MFDSVTYSGCCGKWHRSTFSGLEKDKCRHPLCLSVSDTLYTALPLWTTLPHVAFHRCRTVLMSISFRLAVQVTAVTTRRKQRDAASASTPPMMFVVNRTGNADSEPPVLFDL